MYTDFPNTRYQGSKKRILDWIKECLDGIEFDTALDVFGGTGSVSYLLKSMGKKVTFNDFLLSNVISARALICNSTTKLSEKWIKEIATAEPYEGTVSRLYSGIFFTDEENKEIDKIANGIFFNPKTKLDGTKRNLALFALSQTLLMKRPFNLFHRANLNIRLRECDRKFGNKTTWERPITELMLRNLKEANNAVFSNGKRHYAHQKDALMIGAGFDLVYIDPPYCSINKKCADYQDYYSFLDGVCNYPCWTANIDMTKKNLPLQQNNHSFTNNRFEADLKELLSKHSGSIVVLSYKSPGWPSIDKLGDMIRETHREPTLHTKKINYALNRNNGDCRENLLIAMPKK